MTRALLLALLLTASAFGQSFNEVMGIGSHAADVDVWLRLESDYTNEKGSQDAVATDTPSSITGGYRFDGANDSLIAYPQNGDNFEVPGGFTNTGLTYDSDDDTWWVGDFTNQEVVELEMDGTATGRSISLGFSPQGVYYDSGTGTMWVSDLAAKRIRNYTLAGSENSSFGTTPNPNGLSMDSSGYLCSPASNAINRWNTSGTAQSSITVAGSHSFDGVHGNADGTYYLTDDTGSKIYHVNGSGTVLDEWTGNNSPEDIVEKDGDLYYCADREFHESLANGNRVMKLEPTYSFWLSIVIQKVVTGGTTGIAVQGNPVTGFGYGLYGISSGWRVFVRDGSTQVFSDQADANAATTVQRITLVFDADNEEARLYINSTLAKTIVLTTINFQNLQSHYRMGFANATDEFNRFANIDLYDCTWGRGALTTAEVGQLVAGAELVNSVAPAVSGTETEDETLSVTTGTWALPAPLAAESNGTASYAYQWTRSNDGAGAGEADISGATSSTYTLQSADVGKFIRCRVRASNDGGYDPDADTNSDFTGSIASSGGSTIPVLLHHYRGLR